MGNKSRQRGWSKRWKLASRLFFEAAILFAVLTVVEIGFWLLKGVCVGALAWSLGIAYVTAKRLFRVTVSD